MGEAKFSVIVSPKHWLFRHSGCDVLPDRLLKLTELTVAPATDQSAGTNPASAGSVRMMMAQPAWPFVGQPVTAVPKRGDSLSTSMLALWTALLRFPAASRPATSRWACP